MKEAQPRSTGTQHGSLVSWSAVATVKAPGGACSCRSQKEISVLSSSFPFSLKREESCSRSREARPFPVRGGAVEAHVPPSTERHGLCSIWSSLPDPLPLLASCSPLLTDQPAAAFSSDISSSGERFRPAQASPLSPPVMPLEVRFIIVID